MMQGSLSKVRLSLSELRCSLPQGSERVGLACGVKSPLYEIPISGHFRPSCFFMTFSSTSRVQSPIRVLGGDDALLVVEYAWFGAWRERGYVVRGPRLKHHIRFYMDAHRGLWPLCCRGHVDRGAWVDSSPIPGPYATSTLATREKNPSAIVG